MPANLENSAVTTGLEKVSFHSNPKERQCQRMLKLPPNCTHLTRNPIQYSCLENPVDRGAWWAAVHSIIESDMTEVTEHTCIGEGNGNPLQYFCLEKPRDRGSWWAAI